MDSEKKDEKALEESQESNAKDQPVVDTEGAEKEKAQASLEEAEGELSDEYSTKDNSLRIVEYHRDMPMEKKLIVFGAIFVLIAVIAASLYFADQNGFFDRYKKQPQASITSLNEMDLLDDGEAEQQQEGGDEDKKEEVDDGEKEKFEPNKKIAIMALNGGGGAGVAGKMKSYLKENDYENVDAENATNYSHKGVEIYYRKEEMKKDADEIKRVVEKEYSNVTVKLASSGDEKLASIVVIVGK
jgi:hypothetical protein